MTSVLPTIHISPSFRRAVLLHLAKNYGLASEYPVPLVLGVHGPSGEGKTFQVEQVLNELGAVPVLISGGELESAAAGQPAELIRQRYLRAGSPVSEGGPEIPVLVVNDIDTGIGDWGDLVQSTINRQVVYGELMHLCDYPTIVASTTTRRVPIIITGNDFTRLYRPLTRAGRMTTFEWKPSIADKTPVVAKILSCTFSDAANLIQRLESNAAVAAGQPVNVPIAFFAQLRTALLDDVLWEQLEVNGPVHAVKTLARGARIHIDIPVSQERLLSVGAELIRSGQLTNHLKE